MYTLGRVVLILSIAVAVTLAAMFLLMNQRPTPPAVVLEAHSSEFQAAFFKASRVYGRVGCGDQHLAEMTAKRALETGLAPELIAAQVGEESGCNPLAISNRQAVGLMQITTKPWSKQYDFTKINLFNPDDNMRVGTEIMAELVKKYGVKGALIRYYGTGSDGIGLGGAGYAEKIYQISGVK